jgi:K+-sensing histidine kinase KdpD
MSTIDHNALLLQVMAHDLLAPLTAIKWQTEILVKEGPSAQKFTERMQGVQDATQLGISLTKHAHVAGRVLTGSYEQDKVHTSLTDIVRTAVLDLRYQYERHGLTLEVDIDTNPTEYAIDVHLLQLYVWSVAKFFLSSAPANAGVSFRGILAPNAEGKQVFVLIGTAVGIPEPEGRVAVFSAEEAEGAYDQAFVFAKLIHTITPLIGAVVSASAHAGNQLVIETSFDQL